MQYRQFTENVGRSQADAIQRGDQGENAASERLSCHIYLSLYIHRLQPSNQRT